MKIKPDPIESLHKRRKRELDFVFHNFPKKIFEKGLEVVKATEERTCEGLELNLFQAKSLWI